MLRKALTKKAAAILLLTACLCCTLPVHAGTLTALDGVFEKAVAFVEDLWGALVGEESEEPSQEPGGEYWPHADPNG